MCNFSRKAALLVFCLSAAGLRLIAQADLASLTGLVTDSAGAVIRGAKVTAVSSGTAVSRSSTTDEAGYYNFPSLPAGNYEISVDEAGFNHAVAKVTLDPAAKARQNFELVVGAVNTSVEVTAQSAELSHDDSSIGTVVENQVIDTTPLFLRNWDDLIRLVPGVQQNRYTEQGGATASGRTGDFTVHGVHSLQNDFLLDGIDDNTFSENVQELSTEATRPSVDVIQEFKVITNPYAAEYGRSPGAAVSVSTKGGTNEVHGLLFEYLRNRVFDANDFFSNKSGLKKPENIQNQFGGNVGAPILKNRLFGFFDYEGTRIQRGITRVSTVPLPNERIGDFSAAAASAAGVTYPAVYDSLTNQPFPNNVIPASRLDPNGLKLMALFPLPNLPGQLNDYARTGPFSDNDDTVDARVDWVSSSKDTVFFRYTGSSRERIVPGTFGGLADGSSTSAWGDSTLNSYHGAIGWTHIFNPSVVNDLRLGFARNTAIDFQLSYNLAPASDYVPGIPFVPSTGGGLPAITFANFTFLGSPDFLPKQQNPQQYEYVDTLSWTRRSHSFKFGVDIHAPMRNIYQDEADVHGNLQFNGQFTCQRGANGQCVSGTGLSYADALTGAVQSAVLSNVYLVDQRIRMFSGFAQDDWKLTPKLTLNLGLRYDFATPQFSGNNKLANFNPAGSGSLQFAANGSLGDRSLVDIKTSNFAPRIGFAYSPTQNTVIRGGYGIFYLLLERFGSEDQLALNPPFLVQTTGSIPSSSNSPLFQLQNGFPAGYLDPANINYQLSHIRASDPKAKTPYVQQWSIGVQQMLPARMVFTLDYVGSKSTYLDVLSDLNQPINGAKPFPNFGYIEYQRGLGNASYNGLETSVKRRFANGLSLSVAWTWSKSIDDTPEELESNSGGSQNGYNQRAWRGPSDFDIPQRVAASYSYELPFGKGKPFVSSGVAAAILGGWRTSGVYTFSSGRPFTMTSGSNYSNAIDSYGAATAVPNVIGQSRIIGNVNCWFYVSANKTCAALVPNGADAFQEQALGQFGNSGRNTLRGPHINVFDFALMRDFRLYERAGLQARWEVFNLANTPVFGQPNNNLSSGAVGTITSLASDPRIMQFALRLSF
jgi:outer membrane receptor protein involved in Fe transport